MSSKDSVCSLLWNQVSIDTGGGLRICCSSFDGEIKDGDKKLYLKDVPNLGAIYDLPYLNNLRTEMLAGKKPSVCNRCWEMERVGQESFRQLHNTMYPKTLKEILAGKSPTRIEHFSLDFGNKCNLACKMCTPYSSNLLAKEQSFGAGQLTEHEVHAAAGVVKNSHRPQWYEDENFWQMLPHHLEHLNHVYMIGGEPFIIPEHIQLLEIIVDSGRASQISISYSSNFTVLPEKLLDLWSKFKDVQIAASVDGTDEYYEYIRWPVKFSRVEENIKRLHKLQMPNVTMSIHSTIQNLNLVNLVDLRNRFSEIDSYFIPLTHPNYLHAGNMPKHVIARCLDELNVAIKKQSRWTPVRLQGVVDYVGDILKNHSPNPELQAQFFKSMRFYDARRNQSLLELHPYFAEWFEVNEPTQTPTHH